MWSQLEETTSHKHVPTVVWTNDIRSYTVEVKWVDLQNSPQASWVELGGALYSHAQVLFAASTDAIMHMVRPGVEKGKDGASSETAADKREKH